MDYDFLYWDFIEKYHPRYYSDDRVLLCDILYRYLTDDEVSSDDLIWLQELYKTKKEVILDLERLENLLLSETIDYFFKTKLVD